MIQYTNQKLCKKCGGRCCKKESCLYAPEDFEEITFENLLELYQKEQIMFSSVLDYTETKIKAWIVRPPQVDCERIQLNIWENSRCAFLTDTGCSYDYHHRPRGAKLLIPREIAGEMCCENMYDLETAANEWERYKELIEEVIHHIYATERMQKSEFTFDHIQCRICGGRCCKKTGCFFSPKDFKNMTFDKMKRIMQKGYISIVEIKEEQSGLENPVYALKIRNNGEHIVEPEPGIYEGCIVLEKDGCPFDDEDRPYGGKALIPELLTGRSCAKGYSFRQVAEDWYPHQKLLIELIKEFDGKDIKYEGIY